MVLFQNAKAEIHSKSHDISYDQVLFKFLYVALCRYSIYLNILNSIWLRINDPNFKLEESRNWSVFDPLVKE